MVKKKEKTRVRQGGNHMSASALKQFLDTNEIAARTRNNLGLETIVERDDAGNVVEKEEEIADHAPMNEEGIKANMAKFRNIVDKNQSLSIYDASEIQNIMEQFHENTARFNILMWGRFGIDNRGDLDSVIEMLTNNAYSIYKRADGGKTLEKLAESSQEVSKTSTDVNTDNNGGRGLFNR